MSALGYELVAADGDRRIIADPTGLGVKLALNSVPHAKVVKDRLYLDIFLTGHGVQPGVAAAERRVGLGATRYLYVAEGGEEVHRILRDPEGNGVCCVLRR